MKPYIIENDTMIFEDFFSSPLTDDILEDMKKIKKIEFGNFFNEKVDNLPDNITHIHFGLYSFNQSVDNLPCNITHLYFSQNFNQSVDFLPCSVEVIHFGYHFNQKINNLPSNVKELKQ